MSVIYIMTLLVLMGTDIFPSEVHAGSSKNSDSRDSKGNDATYCKTALPYKQTVENKIKYLNDRKQPLPTCKCGPSGSISKIDILDASSGKNTTLVTCSGGAGPQIPVQSDAECCNIGEIFRPDLDKLCRMVRLRCKNYTVYRCGSPAEGTTQARTTALSSTTSIKGAPTTSINVAPTTVTSTPLQTTTSVPSTTVTSNGISIRLTPFQDPNEGYPPT